MIDQAQAIAILFSLVNPAICLVMFTGITQGRSAAESRRAATLAMASAGLSCSPPPSSARRS